MNDNTATNPPYDWYAAQIVALYVFVYVQQRTTKGSK